jgi:hypothetical protein
MITKFKLFEDSTKFKLFENFKLKGRHYYALKVEEDYFTKQLEKIGCPKNIIKMLTNDLKRELIKDPKLNTIFVGVKNDYFSPPVQTPTWKISDLGSEFAEYDYEYEGLIRLSKEEREEIELNRATKKYNL